MKIKKTMKYILALGLFVVMSALSAQTDAEKATETVNKNNIEGHIYFLADDLLKGRATGSAELKIAASYLANTLRSYGVKPNPKTGNYYQQVQLKQVSPPSKVEVQVNGIQLNDYALIAPAPVSANGDALFLNYGLESDYKGKDVKGKIVVLKAGGPDTKDARAAFGLRSVKQKLAKANGVLAIVELLDTDKAMWSRIDHNFNEARLMLDEDDKNNDDQVTHIWILDSDGKLAKEFATPKSLKASVTLNEKQEEIILSQNVIGTIEGTDPKLKDEYVIYSAHYDHIGIGRPNAEGDSIYNGARDNAIGTTAVLTIAENLAKYPTKRSALFILFTGEEKGLLGSQYYVQNPVLPLNQMIYCFNTDGGGYNNTSLATIAGLKRTTAQKHMVEGAKTFGLKALDIDDVAPEQGLFDRSDNVSFAAVGIPAPTYSTGFDAFDEEINKYYHQAGDEADSIDYDYLVKFYQGYVLSGRLIANDPEKPFWVKGDKYEAAGNVLYGKGPDVPIKN